MDSTRKGALPPTNPEQQRVWLVVLKARPNVSICFTLTTFRSIFTEPALKGLRNA